MAVMTDARQYGDFIKCAHGMLWVSYDDATKLLHMSNGCAFCHCECSEAIQMLVLVTCCPYSLLSFPRRRERGLKIKIADYKIKGTVIVVPLFYIHILFFNFIDHIPACAGMTRKG